jgi:hypothetical protein
VFWDITPQQMVNSYVRFEEADCHLQDLAFQEEEEEEEEKEDRIQSVLFRNVGNYLPVNMA